MSISLAKRTRNDFEHIAWMCLCSRCGDRGEINCGTISSAYETCPRCDGTGREPVPWSEIFRAGRLWMPDCFNDHDEELFDDEN